MYIGGREGREIKKNNGEEREQEREKVGMKERGKCGQNGSRRVRGKRGRERNRQIDRET